MWFCLFNVINLVSQWFYKRAYHSKVMQGEFISYHQLINWSCLNSILGHTLYISSSFFSIYGTNPFIHFWTYSLYSSLQLRWSRVRYLRVTLSSHSTYLVMFIEVKSKMKRGVVFRFFPYMEPFLSFISDLTPFTLRCSFDEHNSISALASMNKAVRGM